MIVRWVSKYYRYRVNKSTTFGTQDLYGILINIRRGGGRAKPLKGHFCALLDQNMKLGTFICGQFSIGNHLRFEFL